MIIKDLEFLRGKSELVSSVEEAKSLLIQLKDNLKDCDGLGLSAIQIGIPKQIAIVNGRQGEIVIINPEIIERDEEFIFNGEGCLSFPKIFCKSKRYRHFTIKNNVIDGNSFREEQQYYFCGEELNASDYEAIAVQHEIDHFWGLNILRFECYNEDGSFIKIGRLNRNDLCWCGSGKKYKKCCIDKED